MELHNKLMITSRHLFIGIIVIGLLSLVFPVYANAGVPMLFITFPRMLIALIPIIFVEAYIITRRLHLPYKNSLLLSALANLVSTLIGIPITWGLLVGVQLLTGGGGAYGINSLLGKFIAVTWQAPWLIPYESQLGWMIPAASLFLLIPFFFASYVLEFWIIKWRERDILKQDLKKTVWSANLVSYAFLALVAIGFLIWSIFLHFDKLQVRFS